jgi:hypothetical protein
MPTSHEMLSNNKPGDTEKAVPVTVSVNGLGRSFDYSFAPFSVTVLQIDTGH